MTFEINTDYKKQKELEQVGEVKDTTLTPQNLPTINGVTNNAQTHANNFDIWSSYEIYGNSGNTAFANAGGAAATVPQPPTTNSSGGTNTIFDAPPITSGTTSPIQKTELASAIKGITGKDNPQPAPTATEILNNVYDGYKKFIEGEEIA